MAIPNTWQLYFCFCLLSNQAVDSMLVIAISQTSPKISQYYFGI